MHLTLSEHQAIRLRRQQQHFMMVKIKNFNGSAGNTATNGSCISKRFGLLVVLGITAGLIQPITKLSYAFTTSANQDLSALQNYSGTNDSITSTSTVASQLLQESNILSAIKQFQESNEAFLNRSTEANVQEQLRRPTQNGGGPRKMIRSRYRLRTKSDAPNLSGFQTAQFSNYSQPLDAQSPTPLANNLPNNNHHQNYHDQHSLARALTGGGGGGVSGVGVASIADSSPHISYATYLTSSSQRAPVHQAASESGSSGLVLDEPTSYNQEGLLDYTPPHHLHQSYNLPPASGRMFSATGRTHSTSATASNGDLNLPYFLASPSMNSLDYYGNVNTDHQQSSGSDHDHFVPRSMMANFSDHLNFEAPPYYSTSSHSGHFPDYSNHYGSSGSGGVGRSRWSWPWTDASNFGLHSGGPLTAATFKKHYHHHMPAQHKEHDHHHHHHEEHDHQMSKWEHGISIGEIACIAIAVVLGVIILGSPFFLLFLMLFNGGNLFGGTQMGLLAPTTAGGAPAAAAGRRRRKRSVMSSTGSSNKVDERELSHEAPAKEAKELDLHGIGEYLFERLSPFMEQGKLMRSFERIMNVKDDIESIVADLAQAKQAKGGSNKSPANGQNVDNQHIEMRRRRRK